MMYDNICTVLSMRKAHWSLGVQEFSWQVSHVGMQHSYDWPQLSHSSPPKQKQAFAINHTVRITLPGPTGAAGSKPSDIQNTVIRQNIPRAQRSSLRSWPRTSPEDQPSLPCVGIEQLKPAGFTLCLHDLHLPVFPVCANSYLFFPDSQANLGVILDASFFSLSHIICISKSF